MYKELSQLRAVSAFGADESADESADEIANKNTDNELAIETSFYP